MPRRRVPEVVQTSGMDCGPAALTCLLGGFGIRASYARLRDACATDVDGTSIDAMEDAARRLGLEAQQVMLPVEHLLLDEAEALPAVVVTRQPGGLTHFVVVWRRHGRLLQVMDPAVGRRWVGAEQFLQDVYRHEFAIPAAAFERWIRSDAFREPLLRRLATLGMRPLAAVELVDRAAATDGWLGLAAVDAAARAIRTQRGGSRRAGEVGRLSTLAAQAPEIIDDEHWFARPSGPETVAIRGAVLIRVRGRTTEPPDPSAIPPDLAAALTQIDPSPGRFLWQRIWGAERSRLVAVALGAVLAAAAVLIEASLLRTLLSPGAGLGGVPALIAVGVVLLLVDLSLHNRAAAMGRRLEGGIRSALLARLPGLPDRYLSSRPLSDLAERAHRLHRLRELPAAAVDIGRSVTQLVLLPLVIALIDPPSAVPAVLAATVGTAAALILMPAQAERDLRVRSHVGAVARFYLDALVGLVAVRAHGAERVIEGEHTRMLGPWAAAVRAVHRVAITAEMIQSGVGLLFVGWLLLGASGRVADPASLLLLAYWAMTIPAVGQQLGAQLRRYPTYRSAVLRILEPFATPVDEEGGRPAGSATRGGRGVTIGLAGVTVVAGGRPVLAVDGLDIPAGSQVAIVGRSGSGKSTLTGLLLGWHTPATGQLLVDGQPLDANQLAGLRRHTAWVDPTVTVWNASLTENLRYGNDVAAGREAHAIDDAYLSSVVAGLDGGADEPLGERGGLLSGGEAQRVRLGRARLRPDARLAVLDEPFRGLGRDQRQALLGQARRWWPGATLLFVTHDVTDSLEFDRVLVVDGGRIVEDGEPSVLAARPGSRLRALLEAEHEVDHDFESPLWSHVRVAGGRVSTSAIVGDPR